MFTTRDYKIIKIEKKADVTKTVTSWKTLDQNGVHYNNSESFDTKLSSYVQYENGDQDLIEGDLEIIEGWTVRFVFLDDEIFYKICLENNLILFAKKNPDFIGTKVDFKKNPHFHDFVSPLNNSPETNKDLMFEYDIPGHKEPFVLYAKEKQVLNTEKISLIEKSGKTKINTRIYYDDNSSELFENKELAILPGWHIRDIYYHPKNKKYNKPHLRKIWESNKILAKEVFPDNAYHLATVLKYNTLKDDAYNKVKKMKNPFTFFIVVCIFLLLGSIAGFLQVNYVFYSQFEEVHSIKELVINLLFIKGVPLYASTSVYTFLASLFGIIFFGSMKSARKQKINAIYKKVDDEYDLWEKENKTILRKVYDDYIQIANLEDETKQK